MNDTLKLILGMVFTVIVSVSASQCAQNVQVNRLEEREANHFLELRMILTGMQQEHASDADAIKGDLQGVRAEIMGILKERQR